MSDFYDTELGIGNEKQGALDKCATEKGGIWGSVGYGYSQPGKIPPLPGGWAAKWIDRHGMGNHGVLILVPTDERTRALIRPGYVKKLVEWGLPQPEAEKVVALVVDDLHRHLWDVFSISGGTRDRRMYGDSWDEVLEIHQTAGEIDQHIKNTCGCWDDEYGDEPPDPTEP